ncbi:hypothetical protein VDGL01_01681 [Verticillium dahliae]
MSKQIEATHHIDVPGTRLVPARAIGAVRDSRERPPHISVEGRVLGKVELIPRAVRVFARWVADLGAAGDDKAALARLLQRDGASDGRCPDAGEGRASWVGLGRAGTRRAREDARGLEALRCLVLGELGLGADAECPEDGGEEEEQLQQEARYSRINRDSKGKLVRTHLHDWRCVQILDTAFEIFVTADALKQPDAPDGKVEYDTVAVQPYTPRDQRERSGWDKFVSSGRLTIDIRVRFQYQAPMRKSVCLVQAVSKDHVRPQEQNTWSVMFADESGSSNSTSNSWLPPEAPPL